MNSGIFQKSYSLPIKDVTVNPYLRQFGNVMERHLWTKNPQLFFTSKIFAALFKKVKRCFLNFSKKKNLCEFFIHKWRSTIFPICGFFVHNSQIGVKGKPVIMLRWRSFYVCGTHCSDSHRPILMKRWGELIFFISVFVPVRKRFSKILRCTSFGSTLCTTKVGSRVSK